MNKIIYPELSYKIVGILYKVHGELGNRYQEKYYQRAVEIAFKKEKLSYQKEIAVNLEYDSENIGKYFLDFLICDKIVLELKTVNRFRREDIRQVLAYLKAAKKKLGILANFKKDSLEYKRILNSY